MAAVDLIVVHRVQNDLSGLIASALRTTFESVYDDPPDVQDLVTAVQIRYVRPVSEERILTGVSVAVDVPDESSSYIIAELCELIGTDESTLHLLKLTDESQLAAAHSYLDEIYRLEMKLREALTVIFVTSTDCDYYEFLLQSDITLQPGPRPELIERMRKFYENEFFYILFSDYRKVTVRKKQSNMGSLIEIICAAETLEDLKEHLSPYITLPEPYENFLASLSANLDPIEVLRNCVMHNRAISDTQAQNYKRSYEELIKRIDNFLGGIEAES